ncbi:MAG: hypothetical protein HY273_13695, partial [Gammaproteobacteria bacterium]|nr:hypothetical protein [Gammaproteobacteria bacterium]
MGMKTVHGRSAVKVLALLTGVIAGISGCAQIPSQPPASMPPAVQSSMRDGIVLSGVHEGMRVTAVRITAEGYMIDLRYQVVDADKAAPLLSPKVQPYLVEQASGAKLLVPNTPKVGMLRQRVIDPKPEKTYFMFFANPGRYVKPGDK